MNNVLIEFLNLSIISNNYLSLKAYNCNKFKNFNCIPYIQLLYRTVNKQPKKSSTLLLAFSGDRSPARGDVWKQRG